MGGSSNRQVREALKRVEQARKLQEAFDSLSKDEPGKDAKVVEQDRKGEPKLSEPQASFEPEAESHSGVVKAEGAQLSRETQRSLQEINSRSSVVTPRLRDPETGRFISDPANPPSPFEFTDAQRRAAWKKLAEDPESPLTEEQRVEIKQRGWRGPQRVNPRTGEVETMELSHEPVPIREGGTKVVPRWPEEHAAVDPHRKLKKTRGDSQ
jgi:hypothetical protein